jgi:hypothetical protein
MQQLRKQSTFSYQNQQPKSWVWCSLNLSFPSTGGALYSKTLDEEKSKHAGLT